MSDERMTLYLSTDLKQSIETQSDRNDQTQNEWVRDAIRRKLKNERQESVIESTNAEQRLEALIKQVSDEIDEVTQGYRDLMAKTGVYTIANWELIKRDYSDVQRQQVLETGRKRLLDLPGEPHLRQQQQQQQQQQQSKPRASGSHAQDRQEQQQQDDGHDLTPPSTHRNNDSDDSDDSKTTPDDLLRDS